MSKIRINDLARELEVKSKAILEYLLEIGIEDKKSHSSALDDEQADKVRAHFREAMEETEAAEEHSPAESKASAETPAEPAKTHEPEHPAKPAHEVHHEPVALHRTLAEIKADARKTVLKKTATRTVAPAGAKAPAAGPATVPGVRRKPVPAGAPGTAGTGTKGAEAKPVPGAEAPTRAAEAPLAAKAGKPARAAKPASNQPIYPPAATKGGVAARIHPTRRAGEPRPMHPTSRPMPAGAGVPAGRPGARAGGPSMRVPRQQVAPPPKPVVPEEIPITRKITITEGVAIKELSEKLGVRAKDVIRRLLDKGIFATINQTLDSQTASEVSRLFGAETEVISFEDEVTHEVEVADKPEDLDVLQFAVDCRMFE